MHFGHTSPGYRFAATGEFQLLNAQHGWVRADSTASQYERVYATAYRVLGRLPGPVRLSDLQRDEHARVIARRNYNAVRARMGLVVTL